VSSPLLLVLASSSPRRRELLSRLGIALEVAPAEVDESVLPDVAPERHALRVAMAKATAVADGNPGNPVLAADTIVVASGSILGKPRDDEEARSMLRRLAGRGHLVITALALRFRGLAVSRLELARVYFTPMEPALIDWYVATGEPADKAGAYAVQGRGALFVARVEGNVQAVVGLPLAAIPALLRRAGLRLRPEGQRLVLVESGDGTMSGAS
jgi:septum formation protein